MWCWFCYYCNEKWLCRRMKKTIRDFIPALSFTVDQCVCERPRVSHLRHGPYIFVYGVFETANLISEDRCLYISCNKILSHDCNASGVRSITWVCTQRLRGHLRSNQPLASLMLDWVQSVFLTISGSHYNSDLW